MVVNFKIYEINQDVCKLIRTSKLIIIKKVAFFFFFLLYCMMLTSRHEWNQKSKRYRAGDKVSKQTRN